MTVISDVMYTEDFHEPRSPTTLAQRWSREEAVVVTLEKEEGKLEDVELGEKSLSV